MKHLFLIALSFIVLNLVTNAKSSVHEGSAMKTEGTCSGALLDGSPVSLTYYSDFDGYKDVSAGAISFSEGIEGLFTGKREFKKEKDIYSFPGYQLAFPDSTGNTSGTFTYTDAQGARQTVELACEVRDYVYPEMH